MQKCKRPQFLMVITTPKLRLAFTEKAVCPDFNFRRAPSKTAAQREGPAARSAIAAPVNVWS